MGLITQRNQQTSPDGTSNHVCDILFEIKLNICQKWGEGANTSICCVTNEQLNYKLHVQC